MYNIIFHFMRKLNRKIYFIPHNFEHKIIELQPFRERTLYIMCDNSPEINISKNVSIDINLIKLNA